jgi:tRNA dimethylallyltransferase
VIAAEFSIADLDVIKPKIVVIIGPTASGKSELAVRLAESFDGEIINADSMQVYRGLNIGTAKPSMESMRNIPHHLFDIIEPDEDFTAADYSRAAKDKILEICTTGKTAIVVGGTGLYIRALLSGLLDAPGADSAARAEYNDIADRFGNEQLLEALRKVDPDAATRIHPNNRVRIIRALEVFQQTGKTISAFQDEHKFMLKWCNSLKIGISVERSELYRRINARVDRMIADGLVAEVESLLSMGYSPALKSLSSIGYREICDYLAGRNTLPEAIEHIKQSSRHYAKRQLTWFKNDPGIVWFESPLIFECVSVYVKEFLNGDYAA